MFDSISWATGVWIVWIYAVEMKETQASGIFKFPVGQSLKLTSYVYKIHLLNSVHKSINDEYVGIFYE